MTDGQAPAPAIDEAIEVQTSPLDHVETTPVSWRHRALSFLEVLLVVGVLTQLLVAASLMAAGIPMRAPDGSISLLVVAIPTLVDTVVSAGLIIVFLRNRGERPGAVLLGNRPILGEALVGLALVPVVFVSVAALSAVVQQVAPWMHDVPDNPLADLMKTPWSAAIMGFIAVIGGGVREELQRGFILHRFEQHLGGRLVGLLVFSVLFGLGHAEVQGLDAAVYTGTLGFIWGVVYLTRGSIIAPMVSHALFNGVQVVGQLVQG